MSQNSQDPWGSASNQTQNVTPQPTQPFAYPQPYQTSQQPIQQPPPAYYQQPVYPQQQQGLWNPTGVYGGAPIPKKKWPGWATALLVIGVVILIIAVGNAMRTTTPTTQPNTQQVVATAPVAGVTQKAVVQAAPTIATAPKIGKVGETLSLNGYTLTVNAVQKSENFSGDTIDQAKTGNIFIAVDLTIGSQKNRGVSANALFASLKDSQGYKYDTGIFGDKKPSLAGENDIPNGDKVRGWVTFEVPKTANGFVLEYGQLFESEKIRVALG